LDERKPLHAGMQLKPEHFSLLNADTIAASIAAPIREALAPYLESAPVLELHKVQAYGVGGRGLHSFPFQLNLSSSVHRITQSGS